MDARAMERTVLLYVTASVLVLGSCNGDRIVRVTFDEHLTTVSCDEQGVCHDLDGVEVPGRRIEVRAAASATASRFSPEGTYMYIDYMRGDRFVEMELDFPTSEGSDPTIHALMREYEGGDIVFESTASAGSIQIVPPGERYRVPGYGSFHLRFLDTGPDGEPDTDDDEVREIVNAVFEIEGYVNSDAPACVYVPDDAWDDHWISPSIITVVYYPYDPYDDTYYADEGYGSDTSGCEGDTYDDTSSSDWSSDSGGCSGDTYDDTSSSDWSSDSGGCSGDTTGGDDTGGCEGDTYSLLAPRPSHRLVAWLTPALALVFTRSVLRRKR